MSAVYLHIGLPKTGTTHLQDRLWRNRDLALSSSGLLYPGNEIADHFHAAAHLQPDRYLDWVDPEFASAWPTMVAQMKAWPQRSLVSHELFATATATQVEKLMSDLSFADEVHVLVTVRDLGRQLPSVWQENVKNQRTATIGEFVDSVLAHAPGTSETGAGREEPFWEFQDYVRILRTWAPFVGAERVHVITVPKTRTGDDLWNRFLSVIGVDPAALTIPVPDLNSSLSAAQTEFVRRLNTRLQPDDIEWRRYERVMKGQIIGEILFAEREGRAQRLSGEHLRWAAEHSHAMIADIAAAGYRVVGDLDDLAVDPTDERTEALTDAEVLDVALGTVAALVQSAALPKTRQHWQTRTANVVRRVRRRALGVRRKLR
ncbi:sulfotransferase family protein [Gordonia sp. (in: high G+C Gram-positive bacteria)]|uniref:sulfotransferase family protein n=1 Tax=Gordonia sp. (in: high G+C Gram-positive bacteria) TaxID=84139 RepID=UPI002FD9DB2D